MSNTLLSSKNPIVERVLGLSQRPMLIAVVAAIGIHGIVLVLLPALNQPKRPDDERVVDLVELPAGAQALLPNSSPPQFMLPPLQPDLPNVQFDRDFNISSLPNLQDPYNFSLDPLPPIPSLPQGGKVPVFSGSPFPYPALPENKPPVQQRQPQQPPPAKSDESPDTTPSPPTKTTETEGTETPPKSTDTTQEENSESSSEEGTGSTPPATDSTTPPPSPPPPAPASPPPGPAGPDNTLGWYQGFMASYNNGKFEGLTDDHVQLKKREIILSGAKAESNTQPPKFGVVVKNGKIVSGPVPVKTSGNPTLDSRAKAEISRHPFSSDKNGPYVIEVVPRN